MPCPSISFSRTLYGHWPRSPDSDIAGGVAINREGPRFSGDIDIFHDSEARLESAAKADAAALTAAGYSVTWDSERQGRRDATTARGGETLRLEWATDAAFRFFPTVLAMYCTRLISQPTRHRRRLTAGCPAILLI
jgi:hypothetical protein